MTALVLLEGGSAAERCHSPDCVLPAFTAAAPGPPGLWPPPHSDRGAKATSGAAGWAGGSPGKGCLGMAPLPSQPPPHRGSGGHHEPAQDARQGVGCHEGRPLNPHVLQAGQQSPHRPAPRHPRVPPATPRGGGLPHGAAAFPIPGPEPPVPLHPLETWLLSGPLQLCLSPRPGVPAAPGSTHCKFVVWILWAFLEGPRVAELLDVVGLVEAAEEGRDRAQRRVQGKTSPWCPTPGGEPVPARGLTW